MPALIPTACEHHYIFPFALRKALLVTTMALLSCAAFAGVTIHKPTGTGNDFYIVFPRSAYGNSNVAALINSPAKQTIKITQAGGAIDSIKTLITNLQVIQSEGLRIEDSSEVIDPKGALRIQTPSPVSVIGQYGETGISGTYTAMPVSSWGSEYYVLDEVEGQNPPILNNANIFSVPQITIIASRDSTTVKITPTAATAKGNIAGKTFTVQMNAGDVYYISDAADPQAIPPSYDPGNADFSGTHIISTDPKKPIGVIVSQSYTADPFTSSECGNFGMQWLPPLANWDSTYIITPTPGHDTTKYYGGELLRMIFAYDGTTLHRIGLGTDSILGTFYKGDVYTYTVPMQKGFALNANLPFLPMETTSAPLSCPEGSKGIGNNYTFSMMIPVGVHQWSDFIPFTTADQVGGSEASLYFRTADAHNIYFNGVSLTSTSSAIDSIDNEYSYMVVPLSSITYYELRCDSGATAGGAIWGYGQGRSTANNGNNAHTLDPEMVKSFAHPIGLNAINYSSTDITAPRVAVLTGCGYWTDTVSDAERFAAGLNAIWLAENSSPDSSYNVAFAQAPSFTYGTNQPVPLRINILDPSKPAVAALHARDIAGNERDTILTYFPPSLLIQPQAIDLGAYLAGAVDSESIVIHNSGQSAMTITGMSLRVGTHWHLTPSFNFPVLFQPGDSVTASVKYTAPEANSFECDPDTLALSTACSTTNISAMIACVALSSITASGYDFGCLPANDTVTAPPRDKGAYITNQRADTAVIVGLQLVGDGNLSSADQVFTLGYFYDRQGNTLQIPSQFRPWKLPPAQTGGAMDTVFIQVSAHPQSVGDYYASIDFSYSPDQTRNLLDSCLLHVCLQPTAVHESATSPRSFSLEQSYPNPTAASTVIHFTTADEGKMTLSIFNALGNEVATLVSGELSAGVHTAEWDTQNLPQGVYYYRLTQGEKSQTKKIVLVK